MYIYTYLDPTRPLFPFQLRGRVGRASVQAYALLMHPEPAFLQPTTMERLRVLRRETGLGAGHALAKVRGTVYSMYI